jgi:pyruvate,water dikinase
MKSYKHTAENRSPLKLEFSEKPLSSDYLTSSIRICRPDLCIISPSVIQIPASLVVTAAAFRKFMLKNRLDEVVEGLLVGVNVRRIEELQQPAAQIQEVIRSSYLPDEVYHCILEGCLEMGYGATVVWPVTMPSELFHYSGERQRSPYLEAVGPEEIMDAIRSWWASLFESTAILYRELNGQSHRDARITLAAQRTPDTGSTESV